MNEKQQMKLTPIKAIRAKCLDCSCNQFKEVVLCTVTKCSLYPYRMGKRPKASLGSIEESIETL
jgi:hypothetical protein